MFIASLELPEIFRLHVRPEIRCMSDFLVGGQHQAVYKFLDAYLPAVLPLTADIIHLSPYLLKGEQGCLNRM